MLFSRKSPLFAKGLNLLDRIPYLSPCYIYVVSGIATPTFIAIPLGELCLPMYDSACWLHTVCLTLCILVGHRGCTAALQVLSSRLLQFQLESPDRRNMGFHAAPKAVPQSLLVLSSEETFSPWHQCHQRSCQVSPFGYAA